MTINEAHVEYWDSVTLAAVFSIEKFVPLDAASADYITAAANCSIGYFVLLRQIF